MALTLRFQRLTCCFPPAAVTPGLAATAAEPPTPVAEAPAPGLGSPSWSSRVQESAIQFWATNNVLDGMPAAAAVMLTLLGCWLTGSGRGLGPSAHLMVPGCCWIWSCGLDAAAAATEV
jgi:hypothetical protein